MYKNVIGTYKNDSSLKWYFFFFDVMFEQSSFV